ncbi:receptor-transporting protein 4-like [Leptodactylus fuscus]|uniref:receptor-transporting protein 4-like n=1 Tax=Leptodactylus fuscus TaxID=238119 RepID=UPI003F4E6886
MTVATWRAKFAEEIDESEVPGQWILYEDKNLEKDNSDSYYFSQKTFGSFHCSYCRRSWNSSKVFILFDMKLNKYLHHGNVAMRIFKQGCQRCSIMKEPTIRPQNIERVITNAVNYIQRKFYGKQNVGSDRPPCHFGEQDGPHDEEHCEACQYDLCERQTLSSQKSSQSGVLPALAIGGAVVGIGALALMFMSLNKTNEKRRGAP